MIKYVDWLKFVVRMREKAASVLDKEAERADGGIG
jgi:hypothetical protein